MINQAALAQGAGGPERRNTMRKRIAVMKGDGIGPEIVNEALKVLETVASKYGHHFAYNFVDIGGVAVRPTKLRLVVATQRSPSARTPM